MKTLDYAIKHHESICIDGRDMLRLANFVPAERLSEIGFSVKEGETHESLPWTREEILKQLEEDVAFGFEKALNQRGISSGLMAEVVKMWNWILEEGLEDFDEYPMYGLPIFKATAVKYGFENPIGDDTGSESKYEEY